ncbi:MAG: hypothetical protein Q7S57_04970 [bacterium]|nr:hypothetical protein [bacterium]
MANKQRKGTAKTDPQATHVPYPRNEAGLRTQKDAVSAVITVKILREAKTIFPVFQSIAYSPI